MLASESRDFPDQNLGKKYMVEAVSTEEGLSALEADWNRLSETSDRPNAFMTYGWFRAWMRQIASEDHSRRPLPFVLVLKIGGSTVGIAPFIRRISSQFFRVRKLEFATIHADYNDVVLGSDPAGQIRAVTDYLAETAAQWDLVDLRDLRDTGEGTELIESALKRSGLLYQIFPGYEHCLYRQLDGDAASSISGLSRQARHALHRRTRLAKAQGLRTRIIENPKDEPTLISKLAALDNQQHPHRSTPPLIGTYPDLFQAVIDDLGPRGWLYVALVELGAQPIAYQFGFRCGSKLWAYTTAYDRSFSRFSPGTLLLPAQFDYGFERGFDEYDFLRGDEQYKSAWSTGCHRQFRLLIWNRHFISLVRKFAYIEIKNATNSFLGRHI
jgi:CelD/BcsL family acetyltransferase involved in cellulose biosynthesis